MSVTWPASSTSCRCADVISLPPVRHPLRVLGPLLAALALLAVFSTTCSRPDDRSLPPPSSTSSTAPPESTTTVDLSRVALPAVRGETTTTLQETGRASVRGVVVGPDGNVPQAIVRIERLVGDSVQVREVRAGADGTFAVEGLPGGRMRVRAFLPPTLTMAGAEVFFLRDRDTRDVRLTVTAHTGPDVRASTAPAEPVVGDLVNLLVWVAERVVDERGVARTVPRPGVPVQVDVSGWVFVQGRSATDGEGAALFTFRCERAIPVTAMAFIGTDPDVRSYPLEVPACASRPPATTTTTDPDRTTTTDEDDVTTTTDDG